jgi:hypothetical protein
MRDETRQQSYSSIVTHNDFDGLGSAAILSWAFGIEEIRFTGPIAVGKAEIAISLEDIVSDLPYPVECGLWFDHHAGNAEEVKLRGIDPQTIPGRFAIAPSCVRVVYDYFTESEELPEDFAELATAGDLIDSFAYPSLDAWREDTPANRIDRALKSSSENRREHERFLREVTFLMRDLPLAEIAEEEIIRSRAERYAQEEVRMLDLIEKYGRTLPEDVACELFIVDFTAFSNPARIDKKLIGLLHPKARGYVEMKPVFRSGTKTFNIAVSLSLALSMQQHTHKKDMAEIMRLLNIGDGHAGAAAGVWQCKSTREFQIMKEELPRKILELWKRM